MRKNTTITHFVHQIIPLIDSGESISIEEIYNHMETKDLVDWLEKKFPFRSENGLDFSLLDRNCRDFIHDEYESFYLGYYGQHHRKWGIKNNGLNLLVSWGIDIVLELKEPNNFI